jgi:hypothetical protein
VSRAFNHGRGMLLAQSTILTAMNAPRQAQFLTI